MNLYEMTSGYNAIFDMVIDSDANLDTLEDTLQSIECGIEEKVANGIRLIKSLEYRRDAMKAEANRLQKNYKAISNNIDSIKAWYKVNLDLIGKKKISTEVGTMNIQPNPAKLIIDNNKITMDYLKVIPPSYVPDTDKIRADLAIGKTVPGAQLIQEKSLRIR